MATSFVFDRPKPYTSPDPNNRRTFQMGSLSDELILKITNYAPNKRINVGIVPTSIITNNTVVPTNVIKFIAVNELIVPYRGDQLTFSPSLNVPSDITPGEYRLVAYFTDTLTNYIVSDIIYVKPGTMSFSGLNSNYIAGNTYYFEWQYLIPANTINIHYTTSLIVTSSADRNIKIASIQDVIDPPYDLTMVSSSGYMGHTIAMIPLSIPTGTYGIRLLLSTQYPVDAFGSGITITAATLNILSYPAYMERNTPYTITWNSNSDAINAGKLRLDLLLYSDNSVILTLNNIDASLGSETFILPFDLEYESYYFKLTSLVYPTLSAQTSRIPVSGPECKDPIYIPPDKITAPIGTAPIGSNPIPDHNPFSSFDSSGYTQPVPENIVYDGSGNLVVPSRPSATNPIPLQKRANCIIPFPKSGKKAIRIFNPREYWCYGTKSGNQQQNVIDINCCALQTYNPN